MMEVRERVRQKMQALFERLQSKFTTKMGSTGRGK